MQEERTPGAPAAPAAPATLELVHEGPDSALVRLTGELDLNSIALLQPMISQVLEPVPARLTVDISELRFADSSAITLWVRWSAAVEQFELRGASPLLRTIIARMGLAPKFGMA